MVVVMTMLLVVQNSMNLSTLSDLSLPKPCLSGRHGEGRETFFFYKTQKMVIAVPGYRDCAVAIE